MSLEFLSRWRMDISTLSPIHIGTGEEIDPFSYIVDNNILYEFSQRNFLKDLSKEERANLLRISDRNLSALQNFFGKHSNKAIANAVRISRVPSEFASLYKSSLGKAASSDSNEINQLVINRMQADAAKGNPICPGSSLKGSIRTALLESERQKKKIGEWYRGKNFDLQKRLFGNRTIQDDPMRQISVTDAVWTDEMEKRQFAIGSNVVFAVNRKKKREGKVDGGPQRVLEVVDAMNMHAFAAEISIFQPTNARTPKWQIKEISDACNKFYGEKFESELKKLHECKYVDEEWKKQALERVGRLPANDGNAKFSFLLRVGCHSGAEFVTLNEVRKITIKGQRRPGPTATTWWLASSRRKAVRGMKPFGWMIVECTPLDSNEDFILAVEPKLPSDSKTKTDWVHQATKKIEKCRKSLENIPPEVPEPPKSSEPLPPEKEKLKQFEELLDRTSEYQWKQGGSEVSQKANEILNDAESWETSLKTEAVDLLKRYFDIAKFPKSKKGRIRRAKFQKLQDDIA